MTVNLNLDFLFRVGLFLMVVGASVVGGQRVRELDNRDQAIVSYLNSVERRLTELGKPLQPPPPPPAKEEKK